MWVLKSLGIGLLAAVLVALFLEFIVDANADVTDAGMLFAGIAATVAALLWFKKPADFAAETVASYKKAKNAIETVVDLDDADLYALAEKEVLDGKADPGLWSRALVKANGQENLRKTEYMKLRVTQLKRR